MTDIPEGWTAMDVVRQSMYAWITLCMLAAWGVCKLEKAGAPAWLRNIAFVCVGYGPLMCAISFSAFATQWRKTEFRWDKTVKTGKARMLT